MTRVQVLYRLFDFGRLEERELLKSGHEQEAYQFEHARKVLILSFDNHSISDLVRQLDLMTAYYIDSKGVWHYCPQLFVFDSNVRSKLLDLKLELYHY